VSGYQKGKTGNGSGLSDTAQKFCERPPYKPRRPVITNPHANFVDVVEMTYARTGSIEATMRELGYPYQVIWDALTQQRAAINQERPS
jgi:hypothetical protein